MNVTSEPPAPPPPTTKYSILLFPLEFPAHDTIKSASLLNVCILKSPTVARQPPLAATYAAATPISVSSAFCTLIQPFVEST